MLESTSSQPVCHSFNQILTRAFAFAAGRKRGAQMATCIRTLGSDDEMVSAFSKKNGGAAELKVVRHVGQAFSHDVGHQRKGLVQVQLQLK